MTFGDTIGSLNGLIGDSVSDYNSFETATAMVVHPATIAKIFMSKSACDALMRNSSLSSLSFINSFKSFCPSTCDCSRVSASISACAWVNPTDSNFRMFSNSFVIGMLFYFLNEYVCLCVPDNRRCRSR